LVETGLPLFAVVAGADGGGVGLAGPLLRLARGGQFGGERACPFDGGGVRGVGLLGARELAVVGRLLLERWRACGVRLVELLAELGAGVGVGPELVGAGAERDLVGFGGAKVGACTFEEAVPDVEAEDLGEDSLAVAR